MLSMNQRAESWQQLADSVDALIAAWQEGPEPQLASFLPPEPAALRHIMLVELVKVDMEQRLQGGHSFKNVECYAAEFPELSAADGIPCDVIYEEYHLRKSAGENVGAKEFFRRFPKQADQLGRLLGAAAELTTSLSKAGRRPITPEPGQTLDDFDLLTRLGQGAFATVFLARQRSLERLVALKISDDRGREPQTLAQLDHPNIVRVFDHRQLPERRMRLLYMQYVAGGTLQDVIEYHGRIPPAQRRGASYLAAIDQSLERRGESPQAGSAIRHKLQHATWPEVVCWLGARLASALAYAHQRGVLHRDVKPANVLIAHDGNPRLADFNISFSSKLDGATPAAYFGGSLAYMSPEQLEACDPNQARQPDDLDGRSDVYSLGIVLWELLTGSRPFVDEMVSGNWSQTLARMAEQRSGSPDAAALTRLPANCPSGLRKLLEHVLAGNRDQRCGSAAEMARQLDLCLQPRAQRLLELPDTRWSELPRRFPVTFLILGGLVPNSVMSGLNIAYNWAEIVRSMPAADQNVFILMLLAINGIAYAWGTVWALYLCWPVIAAMWEVTGGGRDRWRPPTPHWLPSLRGRALRLGEYAAWVTAVDWGFSGFVIPAWMKAQAGAATALTPAKVVHFMASQTLCGLVAATLTFFLVTLVALRACYPRLITPLAAPPLPTLLSDSGREEQLVEQNNSTKATDSIALAATVISPAASGGPMSDVMLAPDFAAAEAAGKLAARDADGAGAANATAQLTIFSPGDGRSETAESLESQDAQRLLALGRRVWIYFGLAVAAPFLAVTMLTGMAEDKSAIAVLGLVGLIGFGISFWLSLLIRADVAALAMAAQPAGMTLAGGSESSDSFWTESR